MNYSLFSSFIYSIMFRKQIEFFTFCRLCSNCKIINMKICIYIYIIKNNKKNAIENSDNTLVKRKSA